MEWGKAEERWTLAVLHVSEAMAGAIQGGKAILYNSWNALTNLLLLPLWVGTCSQICSLLIETLVFVSLMGPWRVSELKMFLILQRTNLRPREVELLTQNWLSELEPGNLTPRLVLSLLSLLCLSYPRYIEGHCFVHILTQMVTLAS